MDYWDSVFCKCHDSWDDFLEYFVAQEGPKRLVGFTKFGADIHTEEGAYQPGDWLLFGASPSPCTSHLRIFPLKPFSAICHPLRAVYINTAHSFGSCSRAGAAAPACQCVHLRGAGKVAEIRVTKM